MDDKNLGTLAKAYDDLPYTSHPFVASHPALLQGIAKVFGVDAPDLTRARVLELGCASGGNLMHLAAYYPEIELVGVDYSKIQIEEGRKIVQAMGLEDRVTLHDISVTEIDESFGQFDYILCHGVFSWVPPFVQDGILSAMHNHLNPKGVAHISYNVYPGWKNLEVARDAMLFHSRNITSVSEKVKNGRAMINYMHEKTHQNTVFKRMLDDVAPFIQRSEDYYLAHEFYEEFNQPVYFLQMLQKVAQHDLAYLADSDLHTSFPENWGKEMLEDLIQASGNNQNILEQYLDYITNRQFRQSLLMQREAIDNLNRSLQTSSIKNLSYSIQIKELDSNDPQKAIFRFKGREQLSRTTTHANEAAFLRYLCSQSNQVLSFKQILEGAQQAKVEVSEELIYSSIQSMLVAGLISPFGTAPQANICATKLGDRPKIADFNRHYYPLRHYLVNYRNDMFKPDAVCNELIPFLDGEHSVEQLQQIIQIKTDEKKITFLRNSEGTSIAITDPAEIRTSIAGHVEANLNALFVSGFIVQ